MTQRLGLISPRLARDLLVIKKMRNEFAHNVHGSRLESGKIKDYLSNLTVGSNIVKGHTGLEGIYGVGSRGDFLKVTNIILFCLNGIVESESSAKPLKVSEDEWVYSFIYEESKPVQNKEGVIMDAQPLNLISPISKI